MLVSSQGQGHQSGESGGYSHSKEDVSPLKVVRHTASASVKGRIAAFRMVLWSPTRVFVGV